MKINFRPFLFIFVCTVFGILFALVTYYIAPLGIALLSVLAIVIVSFGVIYAHKKDFVKTASAVVAIAVLFLTALTFLIVACSRSENPPDGEELVVTGRVTEHYSYFGDGTFEAVLDNLMIGGGEVGGKLSAYVYDADDSFSQVRTGYILTFTATLHNKPPIDDGVNASFVRSDIRYTAYCYETPVIDFGSSTVLENIRLGLYEHLVSAMGDDAGAVAYGMIAGDRYMISDEISDAFANAGIGHILAVSGLHVGLIFLLINKLFSLLPLPKTVGRTATTLLLILYAIFTGGSPSTIRAVIMCLIVIWARYFGRADSLNSLCLAATVCLCISPFYLFDCGYLMSVSAVSGLIFFARPITSALRRIRLHKKLAEPFAASISVQLSITPVTAYYFHRVYIYSLPVNGLGMGLLSCLFTLLIAVLPFSFIFPALLVPVGYAIRGLIFICNAVTMLPFAAVVAQVSAVILVIPVLLFFASRYAYLPSKKYFSLFIFALCVGIGFMSDNAITSMDGLVAVGGKTEMTIIYNGDERYLFGDFTDGRAAASAIDGAKVGNERFIIYEYGMTEEIAAGIAEFARLRTVSEVRVLYSSEIVGLKTLQNSGVKVNMIGLSDEAVTAVTTGGNPCGWLYASGDTTVFVSRTQNYSNAFLAADVVRVKYASYTQNYPDKIFLSARGTQTDNVLITSYGNSYFYDFETGKTKAL